ncbi:MAG: polyphosphate kinase 1 [Bdellovibrionota bacterium]
MKERKLPAKFFDKELGWLLFNERVLNLSESSDVPELERLNFHNIFHSNLDEFFMKRVGKLRAQMKRIESKDPFRSKVTKIYVQSLNEKVNELVGRSFENLSQDLLPRLESNGIILTTPDQLSYQEKKDLRELFDSRVFPLLTPMVVDHGHPFPLISNLNLSLGFVVRRAGKSQPNFVRVKIPPVLPMWIQIPTRTPKKYQFINLRDLILMYQDEILPRVEVESTFSFRVIRSLENQSRSGPEEAEDLLELMAEEIRLRKYSEIVRIEHSGMLHPWARQFLQRELEVRPEDFAQIQLPLAFKKIDAPTQLRLPKLRYKPFNSRIPKAIKQGESFFKTINKADILVHHPFDSFSDSVEAFIREAADDPQVLSIKMTLYRAGTKSPIIEALSRAARSGKSVICLVELKARLDEERNIQWAKKLEAAEVHVIYGVLDLKTHAKICVVVRKEGDKLRTYAHVGTGNYNAQTAKLYTDLGLFTSNDKLAKELIKGFNYLTGMAGRADFKQILVSPTTLKQQFLEHIEKECLYAQGGKPARIILKCNNFDDVDIVKALYKASQAGVEITLIVRGFSTLVPGVPGLSENIRVISVLGRLLEHSRIYYFSDGKKDPLSGKIFIGSSDLMRRSFQERVELLVPLMAPHTRKEVWEYLSLLIDTNCLRWEMGRDGVYSRIQGPNSFDIQQKMINEKT